MRHRIFIAINLPEDIKRELIFWQEKIGETFTPHQNFGGGPIRWTKKENLHITLIFIGYATDEEAAEICRVVKNTVLNFRPFSLRLTKICFGPAEDYNSESREVPRMVWAKGEKSQELARLKEGLEKSLASSKDSGCQNYEERAFSPHITLARIKQWEWRKIEPEERPNINEEISLNFEVSSIEVMESVLKPRGPEYTILESAELKP